MRRILYIIGILLFISGIGYIVVEYTIRGVYEFDFRPILYMAVGLVLAIIFYTKRVPYDQVYDEWYEKEFGDDDELEQGVGGSSISGRGGSSVGYDNAPGYERISGYDGVWRNPRGTYTSVNGMMYDTPEAARAASASHVGGIGSGGTLRELMIIFLWVAAYGVVGSVCGYLYTHWGISTSLGVALIISCLIGTLVYFGGARGPIISFLTTGHTTRKRGWQGFKKTLPFIVGVLIWFVLFTHGMMMMLGADVVQMEMDTRWRNSLTDGRIAVVNEVKAPLFMDSRSTGTLTTLRQNDTLTILGTGANNLLFVYAYTANKWGWVDGGQITVVKEEGTPSDGGAKVIAVPAKMITKKLPVQRARRWRSWTIRTVDRDYTVVALGESRKGWTPVCAYNQGEGKMVKGYVNSNLIFTDDGLGAKMPTKPEGKRAIVIGEAKTFLDMNARMREADNDFTSEAEYLKDNDEIIVLVGEDKKGWSLIYHDGEVRWMYYGNYMGIGERKEEKPTAALQEEEKLATVESGGEGVMIIPPLYTKGTKITIKSNKAQFWEYTTTHEGRVVGNATKDTPKPKVGETLILTADAKPLSGGGELPVTYQGKKGFLSNYGPALQGPVLATVTVPKNCKIYDGTRIQVFGGSETVAKLKKGDRVSVTGFSEATSDWEIYTWVITADGKEGYILWDNLKTEE